MEKSTPTLSICIPTFNRITYLRELMPLLLTEMDLVNAQGRIVARLEISNNASTDSTAVFLNDIRRPDVLVTHNRYNIGGDNNIRQCAKMAHGKYVWVLGDDDLVAPGSLTGIIEILENFAPKLLILTERDGQACSTYHTYHACLIGELAKDKMFPLSHTLISANIFEKNLFNEDVSIKRRITNYGHMYGILECLGQNGPILVADGFLRTRKLRASFARIPLALCIKQAIYLWRVAAWFSTPQLKLPALLLALNLPVELVSHVMHLLLPGFMRRRQARKAGCHV